MDLLSFLKSSKDARKIFGKQELKIIEKQLYGVSLTQSEKNRLSRDIRAKLDFIKNAVRFSDEFDLKKASLTKKIIEDVVEVIKEDEFSSRISKIILYGSAAENLFTLKSDIDIVVVFDDINTANATSFRKRVLGRVDSRVDIQAYHTLPDKIKREIDVKGKVLYKNEG